MVAWWEGLTALQHIFIYIAFPASLILVVQTILLLTGGDDGGADSDGDFSDVSDGDDASSLDNGLSLFTIRGIAAFFAVGGWTGALFAGEGNFAGLAVILSGAAGTASLFGVAYMFRAILSLQSDGNLSIDNAIGKTAQVYIPIPPLSNGKGKVTITIQERLVELDACTNGEASIPTGETVHVVDVLDGNTLVVEQSLIKKMTGYKYK